MLTNGYQYLAPEASAPRPPGPLVADFGVPAVFVPQKTLAKRRVAMTAGAAVLVVMATVLAWT
jgi:hypothetical protein